MLRSDLVNAKEIGEMFGISAQHVTERLRKRKGFPKARKPGREYLWWKAEIYHWFNTKT